MVLFHGCSDFKSKGSSRAADDIANTAVVTVLNQEEEFKMDERRDVDREKTPSAVITQHQQSLINHITTNCCIIVFILYVMFSFFL